MASKDPTESTGSEESSAPDPNNPYYFPPFVTPSGVHYNGASVMRSPMKADPLTNVKKIRALPMREDDIILVAYPKCGTHWMAEILHMITTGTTDLSRLPKEHMQLEFCHDLEALERLPSPRVFNTHLYMAHLPEQVVEKKVKLVHVTRNIKDTTVSMYHQLKQMSPAPEKFTFQNFLEGYITGKYIVFSHQFDYMQQILEFQKAHPQHPIVNINYEQLHQNPGILIQSLSKFIGIPTHIDTCNKMAVACSFENMKRSEVEETREMSKAVDQITKAMKNKMVIYRKGVVGDWKNQFTVAQDEMFENFLAKQCKEKGFGSREIGGKHVYAWLTMRQMSHYHSKEGKVFIRQPRPLPEDARSYSWPATDCIVYYRTGGITGDNAIVYDFYFQTARWTVRAKIDI